jgi:hypothetical protein
MRQRRGYFYLKYPLQDTIIEKIAPIPLGQSPVRLHVGLDGILHYDIHHVLFKRISTHRIPMPIIR